MEQRFRLQAHEVWREGLVREGVYEHGPDFADHVLGEWDEGDFVWSSYSPTQGANASTGYALFRQANGLEEENFFAPDKLHVSHVSRKDHEYFCPWEFTWSEWKKLDSTVGCALMGVVYGRIFYLNGDELRREGTTHPCDWGLFICSTGQGVWRWLERDGFNWNNTSSHGMFSWHNGDFDEGLRYLTQTPSLDIWTRLQGQLENPESEMCFARRWLQLEDDARFDDVAQWRNGSRVEFETVLRWLLLTEHELREAREVRLVLSLSESDDWENLLEQDGHAMQRPPRLDAAIDTLCLYFGFEWPTQLPLCAANSYIERTCYCLITEPTAHERLEAQLQLTQWAQARGLSFD